MPALLTAQNQCLFNYLTESFALYKIASVLTWTPNGKHLLKKITKIFLIFKNMNSLLINLMLDNISDDFQIMANG
jgi:hypothetical protein